VNLKKIIKFFLFRKIVYSRWIKKYRIPPVLYVECTNVCNAECVFCRYGEYKDKIEFKVMSLDFFCSVVDQYVEMGGSNLALTPVMADPLTDSLLSDRIKVIDSSDIKKLSFYTNSISLKESLVDVLSEVSETDVDIMISISGFNRERYREVMGVDKFDSVKKNLIRLSVIDNSLLNVKAILRVSNKDVADVYEFSDFLDSINIEYLVEKEFDTWGGEISDRLDGAFAIKERSSGLGPCRVSFKKPLVTVDGMLKLCDCRDSDDQLIVDSLSGNMLKDVLWGRKIMSMRDSFFHSDTMPSICAKCEIYRSIY